MSQPRFVEAEPADYSGIETIGSIGPIGHTHPSCPIKFREMEIWLEKESGGCASWNRSARGTLGGRGSVHLRVDWTGHREVLSVYFWRVDIGSEYVEYVVVSIRSQEMLDACVGGCVRVWVKVWGCVSVLMVEVSDCEMTILPA